MIRGVECLAAQFQARLLPQAEGPDQGEIQRLESRTEDGVTCPPFSLPNRTRNSLG